MKKKISFVTTVLNEEGSVKSFLESLDKQTKMPDEVVIVDGGSSDDTIAKIKSSKLKVQNLKILIKKGNRAMGRNEAIKNCTGNIIVCSDAGCVLDKNWLKNIVEPFKNKEVDVAAGFYEPIVSSIFEKSLACYTCVMPDDVNKNFLPSSRSIAFKKEVWEKVGGYPENLETCEDLVFAKKLKKKEFRFKVEKNAIVFWPQRKNIFQAFRQFLNYAIGDGKAFYIRPQVPFLFVRYLLGISLLGVYSISKAPFWLFAIGYLLFTYLVWSIWKNYKYVKHSKAFLYLPCLQLISDWAVILGMIIGFLKRFAR